MNLLQSANGNQHQYYRQNVVYATSTKFRRDQSNSLKNEIFGVTEGHDLSIIRLFHER
jgi:hypothetical protein